jgi:hypothetical protein
MQNAVLIPGSQSILLHRNLWNIKPIFFNSFIDHRNRRGYGKSRKQEFLVIESNEKKKKKINPTKAVPHVMNSLRHHYSRISMQTQFYEATDDD